MPIPEVKKAEIKKTIPKLEKEFCYREGPDLYFYQRLLEVNRDEKLAELLKNRYYLELLYAALTAWDMNSRSAKMLYFDDFKSKILSCATDLCELQGLKLCDLGNAEYVKTKARLASLYDAMVLMRTKGRFVSNAKMLHFMFPDLCVPMDRTNTLQYFYGNNGESIHKYLEITDCAYEIAKEKGLRKYISTEGWNQSIPKMIDNAIIYLNDPKYRK